MSQLLILIDNYVREKYSHFIVNNPKSFYFKQFCQNNTILRFDNWELVYLDYLDDTLEVVLFDLTTKYGEEYDHDREYSCILDPFNVNFLDEFDRIIKEKSLFFGLERHHFKCAYCPTVSIEDVCAECLKKFDDGTIVLLYPLDSIGTNNVR